MKQIRALHLGLLLALWWTPAAVAQQPPAIGYMYPPGGQAGQSTEVILGGYDWTPDMQIFVHDSRIKLEILEPPGTIIVPEPPYWFDKKARRPPFLLPRETKAKLTIPAGVSAGIVNWQVANANGASAVGRFLVSHSDGVLEAASRGKPQKISSLPARVSGQIKHIREVDEYTLTATHSGPVTCELAAKRFGSPLNAVMEIRDSSGNIVADAADTAGLDTALTFTPVAGESYVLAIYDLDFRGNRAFTYQLTVKTAPRVVTAIPSVGRPGDTRMVEFVGFGIKTGAAKLESVIREVTFPADHKDAFLYELSTDSGTCSFSFLLSNHPQASSAARTLSVPMGITGVFEERFADHVYTVAGKKGDIWASRVLSAQIGSLVDPVLSIVDSDKKQLASNDDSPGSIDASLEFKVPKDGEYQIVVSDVASQAGSRAATYHLSIASAAPDFSISIPELLNLPIGGKTKLAIKVTRNGNFQDPIQLEFSGLPVGVTVPDNPQLAAKQKAMNVELTVAEDAAATAALMTVKATATINENTVERVAGPMLVAATIKPPFSIDAEGKDDVTKWPRGTTFPAPVLIERDEGFTADIVLEMTSKQGRHRQGIFGPELVVKPDEDRVLYPVFLPEWLQTTRTSRMVVNGVAKVADPQGNIRYCVSRQKTRMGFLPTGALLKVSAAEKEYRVKPGEKISVPISVSRSVRLTEPLTVELCCNDSQKSCFKAEPRVVDSSVSQLDFALLAGSDPANIGEHKLTLRATLMKNGHLPVISETSVLVQLVQQ